MMTTRLSRRLCLLVPFSLTALAHAGDEYTIDLGDEGVVGSDFTRTVSGCFLDPGVVDLVFLDDETGVVCHEPSVFTKVNSQPGSITDLAVRVGEDAIDRLYGIVGGSVARLEFVSEDDDWNIIPLSNIPSGVMRLISGDVDGDGVDDLVTLANDGVTLRAFAFGAANSDNNSERFTIVLGGITTDIVALNWDGSLANGDEFAVLWGGRVRVIDGGGSEKVSFAVLPDSGHLTSYSDGFTIGEGLAWIASFGPEIHWLSWASQGVAPGLLPLDGYGIGGVGAGDFDGLAGDDLVLTSKMGTTSHVLFQDSSGGGTTFSFANSESFELAALGGGQERATAAGLADFDGDGDLDIIQPDVAGVELALFFNELVDEKGMRLELVQGIFVTGFNKDGTGNGETKMVNLTLLHPDGQLFFAAGLDRPDEVHVTLYMQEGTEGALTRHSQGTRTSDYSGGLSTFQFKTGEMEKDDGRIYYLHIRCAGLVPGGYQYFPGYVEAYTASTRTAENWEFAFPDVFSLLYAHGHAGGGGGSLEFFHSATMAGMTVLFGPQPVDGTGRVPVPVSTPM